MKRARLLLFILLVVFSLTSVAYADIYKDGSKGNTVEQIQQQLKKLGYFQGETTGYFGSQTVSAVKKFQAKRGLQADGIVGAGTYKRLFESASANVNGKNVISTKEIQTALKKLGYYTGKIDGISGGNTKNAIIRFQKDNRLTADGIVGNGTSKILLAAANNSTKSESSSSTSSNSMSIKEIQAALKKLGYYTGTVDGVTGSKTKAAIKKFQSDNKLTADGVVGAVTRSKLAAVAAKPAVSATTAAAAKKGGIQMLDWWTKASKILKIGTIAKITDVRTGKTFKIVRTYGTNHADVEALTANDSKTIKAIWGGWSWSRRPIVVEVNDIKIAASMAAMPHAGVDSKPANTYVSQRSGGYSRGTNLDGIKDNGMDGHIDLHFLNSKTHGTNKVDPKHQAAVREAAKY